MSVTLRFNHDRGEDAPPRVGMAPLVDIVLLLICFYLLVMQSMQARTDDRIELPKMANDLTSNVMPAELVLNVSVEGEMTLNGSSVRPKELERLLRTERGRAAEAGQAVNVVLRVDGRQRYAMLDAALAACREAGMGIVTIRTVEGRDR